MSAQQIIQLLGEARLRINEANRLARGADLLSDGELRRLAALAEEITMLQGYAQVRASG